MKMKMHLMNELQEFFLEMKEKGQPGYIHWLGYFNKVLQTEQFHHFTTLEARIPRSCRWQDQAASDSW
jgi:hypothetical protein